MYSIDPLLDKRVTLQEGEINPGYFYLVSFSFQSSKTTSVSLIMRVGGKNHSLSIMMFLSFNLLALKVKKKCNQK